VRVVEIIVGALLAGIALVAIFGPRSQSTQLAQTGFSGTTDLARTFTAPFG
jgi:hypothetical protein